MMNSPMANDRALHNPHHDRRVACCCFARSYRGFDTSVEPVAFLLTRSGFQDGVALHTCERKELRHWQLLPTKA
jgi:hypothetical protein